MRATWNVMGGATWAEMPRRRPGNPRCGSENSVFQARDGIGLVHHSRQLGRGHPDLSGGTMRYGVLALAALLSLGVNANAQEDPVMRPELRMFIGGLIPTGDHRHDFKAATTLGVQ